MSNLNPNIPTNELSRLMTASAGKMGDYQLAYLTPQLLLLAFIKAKKSIAHQVLKELQQERGFDLADLESRVEMAARYNKGRDAEFYFTDDFGRSIPLADEMLTVLDEARSMAQARGELKASSGHALAAMAQQNVTTYGVLQRIGITATAVLAHLTKIDTTGTFIIEDFVHNAQKGSFTPVFQRQELLQELINLTALSQNPHVILVGQEGVGRRTLVYSLAQLIAEGKGPEVRSVVQMNEAALLEDPLAAIRAASRRATEGILLVPNIMRFFEGKLRSPFPEQVNRELQKLMIGNDHIVIGTATPVDYNKLAQNPIIRQNSNRLDVPPTTLDETKKIMVFHLQRLKQEYEIDIEWQALATAVKLADQYIKTTPLPSAALQLADRACALVQLVHKEHNATRPEVKKDGTLTEEDVMVAASQMTKVPLQKLGQDEQTKYARMVDELHKRIIGQEEAVMSVSRAVKTARVGLRNPKRPIGSFLFLGPSGVGKSELAKALAEFMFETEDAMIVLDMSEYQEEASVNRLIGAPPGYVGYESGGQLTDFVQKRPYTVVLFDEIEKAHPRVLDVLLQVLDEGRLTDGQGKLTTFSETVIIMTSNLGARHMLVPTIGEREREQVMESVRNFLRPEFINRIDDVILFHQLTPPQLAQILDLMLRKEFKLAGNQGLQLQLTQEAKEWLLAQNDEPEYGARPLRRIIARYLREPLADFLLTTTRESAQTRIEVTAGEDGLQFKVNENE